MRQLLGTLVAALAVAGSASTAAHSASTRAPLPPWTGGYGVVTPLEERLASIARELSGRPAGAYCNSSAQWQALARSFLLLPDAIYAFVPLDRRGRVADFMQVSPLACRLDDAFMREPARLGQKRCETGTRTASQTQRRRVRVRKRVRVKQTWVWRTVAVWRVEDVFYEVPVFSECDSYQRLLETVAAVGHEAMHIAGITSEAVAECLGLQVTTIVAQRLGATTKFAYEIGRDYVSAYDGRIDVLPEYWSSQCYDGGTLDLWPKRPGWPTPAGILSPRVSPAQIVDLGRFAPTR